MICSIILGKYLTTATTTVNFVFLGFHQVLFHDGHYCSRHLYHTHFCSVFCQPLYGASGHCDFDGTLNRLIVFIMILILTCNSCLLSRLRLNLKLVTTLHADSVSAYDLSSFSFTVKLIPGLLYQIILISTMRQNIDCRELRRSTLRSLSADNEEDLSKFGLL